MYLVTGVVINPYIASNVGIVLCTEWISSFPGIVSISNLSIVSLVISIIHLLLTSTVSNILISKLSYPYINVSIGILLGNHINTYACPSNINSLWNMGFLLYHSTSLQIVTGILLSLHYT